MTTRYPYRGREREHRVVAAEKLGRPLAPGEVVHHINGDVKDNRPENLHVFPSSVEHLMYGHGSNLVTISEIEEFILLGYGSEEIIARCKIGAHRLVRIRRRLEGQLGCRVTRVGERFGLIPPPPKKIPTFDWHKAKHLRDKGATYKELGALFGVTPEAVRYAVRKLSREDVAA